MNSSESVELLTLLFVYARMSLPWLFILGVAVWEVLRIVSFRKKNGAVIWRPGGPRYTAFLPFIAITLMLFAPAILISVMGGTASFFLIAVLLILLIPHFSDGLRRAFFGIYEVRIVGDQFVSEWDQIEKLVPLEDRIRLVDKSRGAVDFLVEQQWLDEVKQRVEEKLAARSLEESPIGHSN